MKNLVSTLLIVFLLFSSCSVFNHWNNGELVGEGYSIDIEKIQGYKALPKDARNSYRGMVHIYAGIQIEGNYPAYPYLLENDSTIVRVDEIFNSQFDDINYNNNYVSPFFISDHEVTNLEYRKFTNWVKEKLARELPAKQYSAEELIYSYEWFLGTLEIAIYPDTTCWGNAYDYLSDTPISNYYNWHPNYDNHPVVGVSYQQAMAYCDWRTDRLNEDILITEKILDSRTYTFTTNSFLNDENNADHVHLLYPSFRLPTEIEWIHAAGTYSNDHDNRNILYPWTSDNLTDEDGEYMANFGFVYEQNQLTIKEPIDDGYQLTGQVFSYNPNYRDLYNMAGNVAEWVLGDCYNDSDAWMFARKVSYDGDNHNPQSPGRMVKGGSWADGILYLIPSTRSIYKDNQGSSKIGFRIAMSVMGEEDRVFDENELFE